MPPLSKIPHKTREITQALRSTCWYVYHQAAPTGANPAPASFRVFNARRRRRGQFQVRYLQTGEWHDVAPADLLYQQ